VLYGPEGVGKSTFAGRGLVLDYERGTSHLDVARVEGARDWASSLKLAEEACVSKGDWTDVTIDTVDKLEEQATRAVIAEGKKGQKSLGDFGYGDGYEALVTKWRELLFVLESAAAHGRTVWLVAHVQRTTVNDPTLGEYALYTGSLQKRDWNATAQWADSVLFSNYETVIKDGRQMMTGNRLLFTTKGAGFSAKHRPNIAPVLPLDYDAYAAELAKLERSPQSIRESILAECPADMLERINAVLKSDGDDVAALCATEATLKRKLQERQTSK
jgi:hypothetical protein